MMVYFAEGRDGTVSVLDRGPGRFLIINGLGQGGRSKLPPHYYPESMLVGLVPVIHVEQPENALLIGLGAGVTVEWLTELGVPRVKVAEIEPRVIGAVKAVFMGESPLDDDRVEVEIDDARHLLLTSVHEGGERFDIISSMPAHPWVSANLFTREFFELAKANLSPKGVFSTWFGTIKMDAPAVESLFRAFSQVFPYYVIYFVPEAASYYLVGAEHPLRIDPGRIESILGLPVFADERALKDPYFLPARLFATGDTDAAPLPPGMVNTDDSAFVEVHSPRAGTTSPKLTGFLPREYLHPSLVEEGRRKEFLIEVMEQLLGTPRGRFPESESPLELGRAARTLDAAKELFTSDETDYFRGRIALASGEREGARTLLASAAAAPGGLAARARKFQALTHASGTRERLEALLTAEPSSDVFFELLDGEGSRALERVPKTSVAPDEDPVGWFLWKAATTPAGGLSPEDRSIFLQDVGPRLGRIARVGLLRAAEDFCRDQGLLGEAETFGLERRGVASPLANRLRDAGNAAGREGRFYEAADTLWQANQLEPANESILQPLLRALVEIRDEERTARLIEQFRFLGYSERKIQALLQSARDRQLAF
jgi:spermidine synthase